MGLFLRCHDGAAAIQELGRLGFGAEQLSFIAARDAVDDEAFLHPLERLEIPGLGPALGRGALAHELANTGPTALLTRSFTTRGVPPTEAQSWLEALRAGRVIVAVDTTTADEVDQVCATLDRHSSIELEADRRIRIAAGAPPAELFPGGDESELPVERPSAKQPELPEWHRPAPPTH